MLVHRVWVVMVEFGDCLWCMCEVLHWFPGPVHIGPPFPLHQELQFPIVPPSIVNAFDLPLFFPWGPGNHWRGRGSWLAVRYGIWLVGRTVETLNTGWIFIDLGSCSRMADCEMTKTIR